MALSPAQLNTIYQNVLFRNADVAGIQFFANRTDISDAQVRQQIELSGEANQFISPIVRLYQTVLGRVPDTDGLRFFSTQLRQGTSLEAVTGALLNSAEFRAKTTATAGSVDTTDLTNTNQLISDAFQAILGRAPAPGELTFFQGRSAASIVSLVAGSPEAAQVNAAGTLTFLDSVALGTPNGGTLNNQTGSTGGGGTGTAVGPLTVNTDTIIGSANNDTLDASQFISTAGTAVATLNNADSIDLGAGNDTVNIQLPTAAAVVTPASFKNVETVNVQNTSGGAVTLNLLNGDASTTTLGVNNSNQQVIVDQLQSKLSTLNLTNVSANVQVTNIANAQLAGTTDALTVNLNNVTGNQGLTLSSVGNTNNFETLTLNSTGSIANAIGTIADVGLTRLNVTGSANLTVVNNATTLTTIDASAFTGNLNLTTAPAGTAQTITGGTGADTINIAGSYTTADVINGGAGTDTLVLQNAELIAATTVQSNVSQIENLSNSTALNGTVSLTNFGATGFVLGAGVGGASVLNYSAGTGLLNLGTQVSGGNDLTVNVAGTATNDVLNVTIGTAAAGNAFGAGNVIINGAETVNLNTIGGADSFGGAFTITDTAATQSLIITGNQGVTFTGAVRADVIDASAVSGTGALVLNGGTGATATTITGTLNADTLIGSTAGDIISGGAGNDQISNQVAGSQTTTAADILTGGAGNDSFRLFGSNASAGTAIATAEAGAANVTDFTVGASATTTDLLVLSATVANYGAGGAFFGGIAAAAAGATVVQNVGQNAAATAIVTGTDLIKLTTGVATTGLTLQESFNAAIGSGSVTGLTANDRAFVSFYDTTNSKAVVGIVNAANGTNTAIESGDVIQLVGTINMTATDYATFNQNQLQIIA